MGRHLLTIVSLVLGMLGSFFLAYDLFGKATLRRALIILADVVLSLTLALLYALVGWLLFDRGETLSQMLGGLGIRVYFGWVAVILIFHLWFVLQPALLAVFGQIKDPYDPPFKFEDDQLPKPRDPESTKTFFYETILYRAMDQLRWIESMHRRDTTMPMWRILLRYARSKVVAGLVILIFGLALFLVMHVVSGTRADPVVVAVFALIAGGTSVGTAFQLGEVLGLVAEKLRATQQERIMGGVGAALTFFAFLMQLILELFS